MRLPYLSVLSIALSANLSAAIIYYDGPEISIPADFDGVYLDFDDYTNPASVATDTPPTGAWDINLFYGGGAIATSATLQPVTETDDTNAAALGLSSGDVVSVDQKYPLSASGSSGSLGHMGTGSQQWENGERAYLGFQIQPASFPDGSQPANTIYGFMDVTLRDDGTPGTIHNWAWDPTGASVTIPEPNAALLAALALSGLLRRRRC